MSTIRSMSHALLRTVAGPQDESVPRSPTRLERPAYLLAFPFSFSTATPNNPWMLEMGDLERAPDVKRAMLQFLDLYRFLASEALIYLLPAPSGCGLQDVVFTSNLGIVLDHLPERDVVVLSNFTSAPRVGESAIGLPFFRAMGYEAHLCPGKFEGDADLKHLSDDVYVGGYGIRSERSSYDWMEREFGMQIVKLRLTDSHLYHLDCSVFPITREQTLVCTKLFAPEELQELEKHTGIIDVSVDECYSGITNSLRLSSTILNASNIHELKRGTEEYAEELRKNRRLEDIAAELAFEVSYFNLSEYLKSGALLSCMVMHLNRYSYRLRLT